MICEACATATTAPKPEANSLSKVEPGGAIWTRAAASGVSESSRILRTSADAALAVGHDRDLLFLQVRDGLDLLAAGTDQQQHVMIEDRDRAGAGRDLGVGAQNRKVGFLAVELRQRLGIVAVGHDLEPQPRGIVLQHRRQPGGEARLGAVGLADGKHQRLGISQPGPAAPHRGGGQDQGQDGKQHDLGAVAFDDPRTAARHFRMRRWGFSTHGSYPVRDVSPPNRRRRPSK